MGRLMGVTVNVVLKSFYYAQNWQNIFVSHNPIKYMHDFFLPRSLDFSQLLHTYIVRDPFRSCYCHTILTRERITSTAQCTNVHYTHTYTCLGPHSNCIIVIVHQEELGRTGTATATWPSHSVVAKIALAVLLHLFRQHILVIRAILGYVLWPKEDVDTRPLVITHSPL